MRIFKCEGWLEKCVLFLQETTGEDNEKMKNIDIPLEIIGIEFGRWYTVKENSINTRTGRLSNEDKEKGKELYCLEDFCSHGNGAGHVLGLEEFVNGASTRRDKRLGQLGAAFNNPWYNLCRAFMYCRVCIRKFLRPYGAALNAKNWDKAAKYRVLPEYLISTVYLWHNAKINTLIDKGLATQILESPYAEHTRKKEMKELTIENKIFSRTDRPEADFIVFGEVSEMVSSKLGRGGITTVLKEKMLELHPETNFIQVVGADGLPPLDFGAQSAVIKQNGISIAIENMHTYKTITFSKAVQAVQKYLNL